MTCACSLSRFRWLRRLCPLVCALVGCCFLPSAEAQNLGKPLQSIGREIRINKGDSVIPDAANATWLPDNATIAFLSEAMKPHMLFSLKFTRPATGALLSFYEGRTFRDVAWLPGVNSAIAVEQDHNL